METNQTRIHYAFEWYRAMTGKRIPDFNDIEACLDPMTCAQSFNEATANRRG